jgi:hypothetical protein
MTGMQDTPNMIIVLMQPTAKAILVETVHDSVTMLINKAYSERNGWTTVKIRGEMAHINLALLNGIRVATPDEIADYKAGLA